MKKQTLMEIEMYFRAVWQKKSWIKIRFFSRPLSQKKKELFALFFSKPHWVWREFDQLRWVCDPCSSMHVNTRDELMYMIKGAWSHLITKSPTHILYAWCLYHGNYRNNMICIFLLLSDAIKLSVWNLLRHLWRKQVYTLTSVHMCNTLACVVWWW